MQRKVFAVVGTVVIVIIVAGIGALFYQNADNQSKNAKSVTPGWKALGSGQYNLSYPETLPSTYVAWANSTPKVVVNPKGSDKIDSNGCYTGNIGSLLYMDNSPQKFKTVTVNGITFCFSKDGDLSAGKNHEGFYYTAYRAGDYFTAEYEVDETICRNNPDDPDSVACMDAMKNYDGIVTAPVQNSIATFKFAHTAFTMELMNMFSYLKSRIRGASFWNWKIPFSFRK